MEDSYRCSPFWKLRYEKYLTLEVLLCIDYKDALEYLFRLDKKAREFLQEHIVTINNGFVNEGLITHKI